MMPSAVGEQGILSQFYNDRKITVGRNVIRAESQLSNHLAFRTSSRFSVFSMAPHQEIPEFGERGLPNNGPENYQKRFSRSICTLVLCSWFSQRLKQPNDCHDLNIKIIVGFARRGDVPFPYLWQAFSLLSLLNDDCPSGLTWCPRFNFS